MRVSGTREWAVAEINCCIGCPHGCRYCYARQKALKDNLICSGDEWLSCRIIEEMVQQEYPRYTGQVMFPTAHDVVTDNLDACLVVLETLLAKHNRVLIVSKPSLSCIRTICRSFSDRKEQILFRFTITARSPTILKFWEPNAPGYQERKDSLALACQYGFQTSVSIEPMLEANDIVALVGELIPFVTHSLWIGKMNRISERVEINSTDTVQEVERIKREQCDESIQALYHQLKDTPLIRWKESIKQVVGIPLATEIGEDR